MQTGGSSFLGSVPGPWEVALDRLGGPGSWRLGHAPPPPRVPWNALGSAAGAARTLTLRTVQLAPKFLDF